MGVLGLWKLLDGTGRPVTLESLEGKVLAVDISIWLNMAVKGMRDQHGHASSDAHLVTLFNRICKLLYFGIKPVFVFDGQAPLMKLKTLQERRQRKAVHIRDRQTASEKLLQNFLKRQILDQAINVQNKKKTDGDQTHADREHNVDSSVTSKTRSVGKKLPGQNSSSEETLFQLPPMKKALEFSSSDEEREQEWVDRSNTRMSMFEAATSGDYKQVMSVDVDCDDFRNLPAEIQHEILTDIKEIRKRRRTQLELMPEKSDSFANYQLSGLLAKRKLSDKLKAVEKQMEQHNVASMTEAALLGEGYESGKVNASKISSEDSTHYILIQDLKQFQQKSNRPCDIKPAVTGSTDYEAPSSSESNDALTDELKSLRSSPHDILHEDTNIPEKPGRVANDENEELNVENPKISNSVDGASFQSFKASPTKEPAAVSTVDVQNTSSTPEKIHAEVISNLAYERRTGNAETNGTLQSNLDRSSNSPGMGRSMAAATEQLPPEVAVAQPVTQVPTATITVANHRHETTEETCSTNGISAEPRDEASQSTDWTSEGEDSEEDFEEVPVHSSDQALPSDRSAEASVASSDELGARSRVDLWGDVASADLSQISDVLDEQDAALLERMKSASRAARDVTDFAQTECQELLKLFGIPFIVSPQEAEAQCAFLDRVGLTEGTITEDSDVWLFGGTVVYKDVFDRKRDPACYMLKDIKVELGLEREHFINIALCSGSDYTSGIEGVGPVRCLEIMKEFPGSGIEGLEAFRAWWEKAHKEVVAPVSETKLKSQLRKLNLPSSFPSQHIVDAYLNSRVNESMEKFEWGIPDLSGIREFAEQRLQWTRKKVDDDVLPVLKRAAARKNSRQPSIASFMKRAADFVTNRPKQKSKRVRRAVAPLLGAYVTTDASPVKSTRPRGGGRGRKRRGASAVVAIPKKSAVNHDDNALGLSESSDSS